MSKHVCLLVLTTLIACLVFACPSAYAASSSEPSGEPIRSAAFSAEIDKNGIVHVTERRVLTLLPGRNYFRWTFPGGSELSAHNLALDEEKPITVEDADGIHVCVQSDKYAFIGRPDSYYYVVEHLPKSFDSIYIYPSKSIHGGSNGDEIAITLKYSIVGRVVKTNAVGASNARLMLSCIGTHWTRGTDNISIDITFPQPDGDYDVSNAGITVRKTNNYKMEKSITLDDETGLFSAHLALSGIEAHRGLALNVDFRSSWLDSFQEKFSNGESLGSRMGVTVTTPPQTQTRREPRTYSSPFANPSTENLPQALTFWVVGFAVIMLFGLSYRLLLIRFHIGRRKRGSKTPRNVLPSHDNPAFLAYLYRASKGLSWMGEGLAAGLADLKRRGCVTLEEDGKTFKLEGKDRGIDALDDRGNEVATITYQFFEAFAQKGSTFTVHSACSYSSENPTQYLDWGKSWMKGIEHCSAAKDVYQICDQTKVAKTLFVVCCVAFVLHWGLAMFMFPTHQFVGIGVLATDLIGTAILWFAKKHAFISNQKGADLLDRCESFHAWLNTQQASSMIAALDSDMRDRYIAIAAAFGVSLANTPAPAGSDFPPTADTELERIGDDALVKALFGSTTCAAMIGSSYIMARESRSHEIVDSFAGNGGYNGGGGCGGGGCGGGGGGCGG